MAHMEDRRVAYKVLVRKPEGKGLFGRPRLTRDNNINLGLQEVDLWLRTGRVGGILLMR